MKTKLLLLTTLILLSISIFSQQESNVYKYKYMASVDVENSSMEFPKIYDPVEIPTHVVYEDHKFALFSANLNPSKHIFSGHTRHVVFDGCECQVFYPKKGGFVILDCNNRTWLVHNENILIFYNE
jgi:hypothetical protein